MDVRHYVCKKLLEILELDTLQRSFVYCNEPPRITFKFNDFHFVHYDTFLEVLYRKLRHEFGEEINNYFELRMRVGELGIHNPTLKLILNLKVDIDTLAGYLRITKGELKDEKP